VPSTLLVADEATVVKMAEQVAVEEAVLEATTMAILLSVAVVFGPTLTTVAGPAILTSEVSKTSKPETGTATKRSPS